MIKQKNKEALETNLRYRLELMSVSEWEAFYLEQPELSEWIKSNDYDHFDDMFENIKLACEEHENTLRRFFTRLSRGYTITQAFEKPEQRDDKFYNIPIEFKGKYYECINELMREHHTSRDEVIRKMRARECSLTAALFLIDADYAEKKNTESTSKPSGASDSAVAKRKKIGWPEKFQNYLFFSNEDIVELSELMQINPAYLLALKQSGYSMEWITKTLQTIPEDGVDGVLEEEFARRIYAGWDYQVAIKQFEPISLDGKKYPTSIDLLQALAESFKVALNRFEKGEGVFEILEIKPIIIETDKETVFFTSMETVSAYYNFDKANLCSLLNTGVSIEEAVTINPSSLYRVGGICFKSFDHACEYYGADKDAITAALKDSKASKFDTFNKIGKSPLLSALG
jgi:hypothetical protein